MDYHKPQVMVSPDSCKATLFPAYIVACDGRRAEST
jgi:hypothetical protein